MTTPHRTLAVVVTWGVTIVAFGAMVIAVIASMQGGMGVTNGASPRSAVSFGAALFLVAVCVVAVQQWRRR